MTQSTRLLDWVQIEGDEAVARPVGFAEHDPPRASVAKVSPLRR